MVKLSKKKNTRGFSISKLACTASRPTKTQLFAAILDCNWIGIRDFLQTGTWTSGDYGDSTQLPMEQAQEWTAYDDTYSEQRLHQLPLHAAIIHLAPLQVVQALVTVYPEAVRLPDNQGNLPLHIAFMTNAKDVSSYLLRLYPDGLLTSNENGNLPIECYHHLFRTVTVEEQSPMELLESRDQWYLRDLEVQVAKDEHRMAASQMELQNTKEEPSRISEQGMRMLRSLSLEEVRTGSVDL